MKNSSAQIKGVLVEKALQRMNGEMRTGSWTARQKVALACRILGRHGHESGLAGQITARSGDGAFLTQALGAGLTGVKAGDLLSVDEDLNVLGGQGMPNPANRFHMWIYRCRADVHCIVHTHSLYASTLSMLGTPLVLSHMDACALYDDVAFLEWWPGVPVGNEEGRIISDALGGKCAILLAHHGMVVAGHNIEEACVLALQFERAARLQLLAASAGAIRRIEPDLALEARAWLRAPIRMTATFAHYAYREIALDAECVA